MLLTIGSHIRAGKKMKKRQMKKVALAETNPFDAIIAMSQAVMQIARMQQNVLQPGSSSRHQGYRRGGRPRGRGARYYRRGPARGRVGPSRNARGRATSDHARENQMENLTSDDDIGTK